MEIKTHVQRSVIYKKIKRFFTHLIFFSEVKIQGRIVFLFHQKLIDCFKNHDRLKCILNQRPPPTPGPATRWPIPPLPLEPSLDLG